MNHLQCEICGKEDALVFQCNYCHNYFCAEHHLPENHDCPNKPKIAPLYVRPLEGESREPSPTITHPLPKQHSKPKLLKKIATVFALVIIAVLLLWFAYPILQQSVQNSSAPSAAPDATPASTIPYVEVGYQTVGWFYSTMDESPLHSNDYNYTYLVLNVTITNYGYSQVNVIGVNGFSVLVNNDEYTPLISLSNSMYNGSASSFYNMQKSYSFTSKLPSEAILLDTGSVNGTVVFKFGNPNVYPQQSQILNKPFVLQYSVSYGDSVPLWKRQVIQAGPYANVIVNQIG